MHELTQAETFSPRTLQVWKTLLNWFTALFQIFIHVLRAIGPHPLLSSSSSPSFKPLSVLELADRDSQLASGVEVSAGDNGGSDEHMEKLKVVLDLDETLICAYETSSLPTALRNQATKAGLKSFELECVSPDKRFAIPQNLSGYASPLVDIIDTDNRFSLRLYRPTTKSTEHREHVKDLSGLSKDLRRIVIVDNNPSSFLLQPLNGIPCIPFSAGQPHDNQLLDVLLPLLKLLSVKKDVRPVLHQRFHMPEWFQNRRILSAG